MTNEVTWRLEHEKVSRLLVHYAIPAVIGTMVNALYNVVDRIFIGQGVGPLAMAGLTLTFPILLFLQAFGMLVGLGAATRVSIHLGRKANDLAEKVLGNALTLTFIITLLTVLPCMVWMDDLLVAFGGSEQTIPYAKDYLNIVVPGTLLTSLSFGFNALMRASGYPKKAMYTMLIGAFSNVLLDPVFIFWLDMGIQGAAIATVISMLLCTLFVMNHFFNKENVLHFRRGIFKLERHVVWNILTIGVSPFAMQLTGSLVVIIQNYALKQHGGDLALGANGIITSVGMLLVMLIIGIAQGMQPIVGFNFGARKYERVEETLRLVIITATIIMGIGCFCSVVFPMQIARAFTTDPALLEVTANGLRISLLVFVVVGSQIAISQFFQSIGIAWKAMFLSLNRQLVFLVPPMLLFARIWGLDGVWYAAPFSDFVAAVTAWLFLWYHVKSMKGK